MRYHSRRIRERSAPSKRTPKRESWLNTADEVERALKDEGHRIWGYVLYRCDYDNDLDWEKCVKLIYDRVRSSLEFYNGCDLLESFRLTVTQDKAEFHSASTSTVRKHFREWCKDNMHKEQGSEEEIASRRTASPYPDGTLAVRYRFCLQVDAASLQSIITEHGHSWVNLIRDDWRIIGSQSGAEERQMCEHPEDYIDCEEEECEPLEGEMKLDVGWMQVEYKFLLSAYDSLDNENSWDVVYTRPPDIALV